MDIGYYVISALVVLIVLTIHEYSHGYAAYRLGDNTAKNFGRLTLNPIKHLDPMGAVCMLFFHVGWAKPVPINPRNFKKPKRDFALTALAGPLSNIVLAFFAAPLYLLLLSHMIKLGYIQNTLLFNLANYSLLFLNLFHIINVGLGVFNLLPIPPFDGSRLLNVILPEKVYFGIMKYEKQIYFATLAWLIVGDYFASMLRMLPFISANPILNLAVGIFSLSDMLGAAISFISGLMISFWQLILPLTF